MADVPTDAPEEPIEQPQDTPKEVVLKVYGNEMSVPMDPEDPKFQEMVANAQKAMAGEITIQQAKEEAERIRSEAESTAYQLRNAMRAYEADATVENYTTMMQLAGYSDEEIQARLQPQQGYEEQDMAAAENPQDGLAQENHQLRIQMAELQKKLSGLEQSQMEQIRRQAYDKLSDKLASDSRYATLMTKDSNVAEWLRNEAFEKLRERAARPGTAADLNGMIDAVLNQDMPQRIEPFRKSFGGTADQETTPEVSQGGPSVGPASGKPHSQEPLGPMYDLGADMDTKASAIDKAIQALSEGVQ